MIPLRGPAEIAERLGFSRAASALLVETPETLRDALASTASSDQTIVSVNSRSLRSVKDHFDLILLWQESRVGSRASLGAAVKRLAPGGRLWVATALKKVIGPRTPAVHRLEREDLEKALEKEGMVREGEARLSAWHVAYGFRKNL